MFTLYVVVIITARLLEPGHLHWKKIIQSQRFLKTKDSQLFGGGCFLRGQVSLNGFKVFNGCIIGPFAKNLRIFCFQKML